MIRIKRRSIVVIAFLVVVAMLSVYFYFDPNDSVFFPRCVVKQLTGYDCPGCGSQRAIHALLHGDIVTAWRYNALMLLLLPLSLMLAVAELLQHSLFPVEHSWNTCGDNRLDYREKHLVARLILAEKFRFDYDAKTQCRVMFVIVQ